MSYPFNETSRHPIYRYLSVSFDGRIYDNDRGEELRQCFSHSAGYPIITLSRLVQPFVHRLVAETFVDNPRQLPWVDHINGDKLDNQFTNLRWCCASDNIANAFGRSRPSGIILPKNVYRSGRRFRVQLMKDRQSLHFGSFDTAEKANEQAAIARAKVFGEFAHV